MGVHVHAFLLVTIGGLSETQKSQIYPSKAYLFYLVGLHHPPHFDFGISKKKKKLEVEAKLSITLYHIIPNILCGLDLPNISNN